MKEQSIYIDLSSGQCPDCGGDKFHPGPRGGHARNVKCAACGSCFTNCTPLISHRINEVAGVYEERESKTLREMALDEITAISEEHDLYDSFLQWRG
jgi:hypothetical protein